MAQVPRPFEIHSAVTRPGQELLGEALIARNPATGAELGRVLATPPEEVAGYVERARSAQAGWGRTNWPERRALLKTWWAALSRDAGSWAELLSREVGKPRSEAMAEVVATLDALRWTVRHAGRALASERIGPGWQRGMFVPSARLEWRPIGIVGLIGTWNYPLFLNAPAIAQALAAGNGVVWKPSELAALSGARLQASLEAAGLPDGLVAEVRGGPEVGRALIEAGLDKAMFTGGIDNGRRVLAHLAGRGIPAVAELSGFDPAVVLPDAPIEPTVRMLAWSAFVGAGQTCVAVKRVIVVGDPVPWVDALAAQARSLRVGDPSGEIDVGPLISAAARERFLDTIQRAVAAGARLVTGGTARPGPGWFVEPTVLSATGTPPETALAGVFGPVVLVRGVPDVATAVAAANETPYGLAASVWGRDHRSARDVAVRLQAGMVAINDAVAPSAHAAAPFGGTKASGFGRVRGVLGLRELAQPRVIHERGLGGWRPQVFPYGRAMERALALYRWLFHPR